MNVPIKEHPTFTLIDEPWIPCIDLTGERHELGIHSLLAEAHLIREIAGESPPTTVALHRLLLAIMLRAYELQDTDRWEDIWRSGTLPAAPLQNYLDAWRPRFDLFHPQRPFMQAADTRAKPKSVGTLLLDKASGNNGTLFDHNTDADTLVLSPAAAARALITMQAFGLAGLFQPNAPFTSAPCVAGVIFLVEGDNLFETLMLNCFYPEARQIPSGAQDRPSWEMEDPLLPLRTIPFGYLDYLTWFNRRILLLPQNGPNGLTVEQMTMGPGLRFDPLPLEPMKSYRNDEKRGHLALRFSEDRAVWRDSAALFRINTSAYRPPQALDSLARLIDDIFDESVLDYHQTRRIMALGMASDQAKIEFFRAERMPLPLAYLRDRSLVDRLEQALTLAHNVANQLWGAARTLATYIVAPNQDSGEGRSAQREDLDQLMGAWDIQRPYWAVLEVPYHQFMQELPHVGEQAIGSWFALLRRTAQQNLDRVAATVENSPRGYKAAVNASQQLAAGLANLDPTREAAHI
jgi:CRISPR system Cascade subunit CasA